MEADDGWQQRVLVLLGTKKGAFILESDAGRRSWTLRGPFCETWPMNHVIADPASGTIYGGGGDEWFGPAVWKSTDLGASWTHSSEGLAYAAGEEPIKTVWSLAPGDGSLYAGVEPAGLFRSDDGGHVLAPRRGPARPPVAAALATGRRRADPALAGAPPERRAAALGRHLLAPACSIPPTAARAGSPATAAPGPTSCRRGRTTRNTANACTAW